ncbi:MAG: holo-ACP synthase [Clostridiaceae bacterium]|nr:holo-ACP synthase [Clostridiaceae bacterium]
MEILNGIDIERISRFESLILKDSFMAGVYTRAEIKSILESPIPQRRAASMFSAKEAVSKALGRGLYGIKPRDIEICHDENGRPVVKLYNDALSLYGGYSVSLSISYKDDYTVTSCLAYKE